MEQLSTSERASKRFYHSIVVGVVGVAHAGNRDAKGSTRCTTGERIRDSGAASLCHHCAVASSNRIPNRMSSASKGAKLWCIQTLALFCRRLSGYACGSRESMGIEFSNSSIRAPFFCICFAFRPGIRAWECTLYIGETSRKDSRMSLLSIENRHQFDKSVILVDAGEYTGFLIASILDVWHPD
jgi:hypothetical protein